MGIYVWGTGCGATELIERGLSRENITAFVESNPDAAAFLGRPVLPPEQVPVSDCDLMVVTTRHVGEIGERLPAVPISDLNGTLVLYKM